MQQRRRVRHSKGGVSFVRFEGFVRETRHAARARRDLANSGARPELEHIGHRTNMMKMTAFAFCNVISMTWSIAKSSMHFFCALLVRVRYALTTVTLTDSSRAFHVVQQRLPSRAGVAIWAGGAPARACSGCTLLIVRRTPSKGLTCSTRSWRTRLSARRAPLAAPRRRRSRHARTARCRRRAAAMGAPATGARHGRKFPSPSLW